MGARLFYPARVYILCTYQVMLFLAHPSLHPSTSASKHSILTPSILFNIASMHKLSTPPPSPNIGKKPCLHGPTDCAKKVKLRFRLGDLDLPEIRKRYTSSRVEEDVVTLTCPCGTTIERDSHSRRM